MEKLLCQMNDDYDDDDNLLNDDEEEEVEAVEVVVSYACEDCDYRWEVTFEDEEDEGIDEVQYCPMCGSANSTPI